MTAVALIWLIGSVLGVVQSAASESDAASSGAVRSEFAARQALGAAESAVAEAAARRALWTVAQEALERARAAYADAAYQRAEREAKAARTFAELGIRQLRYPPYQ